MDSGGGVAYDCAIVLVLGIKNVNVVAISRGGSRHGAIRSDRDNLKITQTGNFPVDMISQGLDKVGSLKLWIYH